MLHLVRWDMRRFRILLSLWLLLVAASAATGRRLARNGRCCGGAPDCRPRGTSSRWRKSLFSVALITLVVQEHPLVGTTAFWMTWPIPPGALFLRRSSPSSLVAMVVAPVLADIVLMCGLSRARGARSAAVAAQSSVAWGAGGSASSWRSRRLRRTWRSSRSLSVERSSPRSLCLNDDLPLLLIDRAEDVAANSRRTRTMNDPTGDIVSYVCLQSVLSCCLPRCSVP